MAGIFRQYNGDSLYLAAFAVSLGLLWYHDKKKNQKNGQIGTKAIVAVALSLVFVFNDLAYRILGMLNDATTYYRFFWMLPVLFLIAYILTQAFASGSKKKIAAAALAFVLCLSFGFNLFFANRDYWNLPQNIYGLDANTIEIADLIMEDWEPGQASSHGPGPVVAFDMYLEYQARAYEPRIQWGISRKAYLYQAKYGYDHKKYSRQQYVIAAVNEGIKEDSRVLRSCINDMGIHYLVIRKEFAMDDYLAEISVHPIAYSVSYTLYKVK